MKWRIEEGVLSGLEVVNVQTDNERVRFRHINSQQPKTPRRRSLKQRECEPHSRTPSTLLRRRQSFVLEAGEIPATRNSLPCSFSTFFSFSITNLNPSSIGGGLAFVISPDSEFVGAAGGSLGLLDEKGQGLGFVAVEFDTLMDVELKDINGNHVGLDLNSVVSSQVGDLGGLDIDLKSGDLVNSWIEYDGLSNDFNVSISYSNLKPKEPILSSTLNLDQYVNDFMYVGFSGSTQGSTEVHNIEWWSFSSSFLSTASQPPPPTSTLMNPAANTAISPPPSLAPSGSDSSSNTQQKSSKSSSCHNQLCKQGPEAFAGVVTAGAFFLVLFAAALIWVYSKKFKKEKKSESFESEIIKSPKEFTYRELKEATRCFNGNRIIGHGAFGTVYKGRLLSAADPRLEGEFEEGSMRRVLMVGLACSHPDPMARPTMRGVVQMLEGEAEVPVVPRAKPSMSFTTSHLLLSLQDSVSDCNDVVVTVSSSSSGNTYIGPELV
ncbi:hypothetical protein GQ457_08G012270 [Hibiscus cannabinus]